MRIAVASGKGGTGKTTISVNLALALAEEKKIQFIDCDVEEPNAHLFLNPTFDTRSCATSVASAHRHANSMLSLS